MNEAAKNPLRKWRLEREMNLDQAVELFASRGCKISTAKLSRMERDQAIPLKMLSRVVEITEIPAAKLRPDLVKLGFLTEVAQ